LVITSWGLGWFISPPGINPSGSIWKHSDLTGFNSYIAFLPSPGTPGVDPSQAGVFALVSADGITGDQQNGGIEVPMALANDISLIMQGITPPADTSVYPRVAPANRTSLT
jgi:hypothetical protein